MVHGCDGGARGTKYLDGMGILVSNPANGSIEFVIEIRIFDVDFTGVDSHNRPYSNSSACI
jgi:hypothetical protein